LAAQYAYNTLLGLVKTAATIDDGSSYSVGLVQSFAQKFTDLGGTITMQKSITTDQVDMRDELGDIATSDHSGGEVGVAPAMIYFPVFMPAGSYIVNQARATSGLETTYLMGADGLWDQLLMLSTGTDGEGFRLTGADDSLFDPTKYTAFKGEYNTKFGADPDNFFAAYGYDAFDAVARAIVAAAGTQVGPSYLIGRQALRDALIDAADYTGITGTINCASNGECVPIPALGVFEVHKNAWPPVHP
jgi:branched-chain amino acid transport system substrate-binding protein